MNIIHPHPTRGLTRPTPVLHLHDDVGAQYCTRKRNKIDVLF
jgi:hypothetical protein